ncbi:MAG: hypothetical protein ACTSV5_04745 [Promethearchaeota archaeon]
MDDKKTLLLKWDEDIDKFEPIESDQGMYEGVFLELIEADRIWKYFYIKGVSLITRCTARRAANGIAKTGYVHPSTNIRYGVAFTLEEELSPFENMPRKYSKISEGLVWWEL